MKVNNVYFILQKVSFEAKYSQKHVIKHIINVIYEI